MAKEKNRFATQIGGVYNAAKHPRLFFFGREDSGPVKRSVGDPPVFTPYTPIIVSLIRVEIWYESY